MNEAPKVSSGCLQSVKSTRQTFRSAAPRGMHRAVPAVPQPDYRPGPDRHRGRLLPPDRTRTNSRGRVPELARGELIAEATIVRDFDRMANLVRQYADFPLKCSQRLSADHLMLE